MKSVQNNAFKGVFSKPSGNHIVVPNFCLGTIQVLRQQRVGGWGGQLLTLADNVGGWVEVPSY